MPAWVIPAISAGASLLQSHLGRKQKAERGLSPESQWLFKYLRGQLGKGAPSYLTRPIEARWGARKRGIRESLGEGLGPGSGLETAQLRRATTAQGREMGEATERHEASILRAIASVVGGTGVGTTTAPFDIGMPAEDIGWMLYTLTQGKKKKGEGGGVAYPGGYPSSYQLNY